jgi:hypothetical protein
LADNSQVEESVNIRHDVLFGKYWISVSGILICW